MKETNEDPQDETPVIVNNTDTEAENVAEQLPGYQEYIRERSADSLTFGDY